MEQLRDLGLQSKVYVRLCMLGVSLAILPRRLDVPLTEEDTLKIVKSLKDLQLGVVQTVIG
jgi:hypothetical protein